MLMGRSEILTVLAHSDSSQLRVPDAYPFLEGRLLASKRSSEEIVKPPRISDGVIFRVLRDLLMLDGERLSYRSLDVEQIGSVYEAMMGFEVQTAPGTSIGLRPDHVVVNLSELLIKSPGERVKDLEEVAGCELTGRALDQLKAAGTIEEVVAAFGRRVSPFYLDGRGMPLLVAAGGMYLQPTEERRRSGSHYTPRSLTEPIVQTTLEPILKQLRGILGGIGDDLVPAQFPGQPAASRLLNNSRGIAVQYQAIISPRVLNTMRWGFTRMGIELDAASSPPAPISPISSVISDFKSYYHQNPTNPIDPHLRL